MLNYTFKAHAESKLDDLATKLLDNPTVLERFLKLTLAGKATGIYFFASLANDKRMMDLCETILKEVGEDD
ncbi:hypothetical protein D3C81_1248900 [compost metagenome]